ncbi:hypothetical protein GPECTOR_57g476 [Gonium pectorale]|uniref:C-CAP/cofactor C-like domain-containing protein n=1 Tax=Gonium pectorale TaxID=33097 RepID=A0A150G5M6_GONPE|nr:hypothetical protein GPECTOR_57g476 [Gonium pectorale]|eukprot:KXZ45186.1 hypothetical protein GPECTOR_57g476 [Gonium pectorale]
MLLQQQQQQGGLTAPAAVPAVPATQVDAATDGEAQPLAVSAASPEQVATSLELLAAEALSLEQSTAAASYYLPLYDQKQCAAAVAALRAAIEGARSALAPRRRFAFGSKKVSKVRGEEVSAAAQAAPAQAAVSAVAVAAADTAAAAAASSASTAPAADADGGASTSGSAGDAVDAPAALAVSEQDRALVARGRGLMGLVGAEVVLRAEELEEGGAGGAAGGDFVLLGLTRCRVVLLGRLRALRLAGLRGCSVVAGPITGAVFADDVRGCSLSLAAYQVRVHRTHASDLFLRVRSKPIIEHSSGVRVAPWAAAVAREERLEALMQSQKLGEADDTGSWQQVDDFGWIKATQSPNWCVMPEAARPREPAQVPERVWERAAAPPPAPADRAAGAAGAGRGGEADADADEI